MFGVEGMIKSKDVTKEQFEEFLKTVPNADKIETAVHRTYEPPLKSYNDFSLGNWPESIIAYVILDDDGYEYKIVEK